jgi:hypothetical protein
MPAFLEKIKDFIPKDPINSIRPSRRPDYAEEWRLLKKAWSLARNGNDKLSTKRVQEASTQLYPGQQLSNLEDWVWRIATFMCQPAYEPLLVEAMQAINTVPKEAYIPDFAKAVEDLSEDRGGRYFTIFKEFFSAYSEFGQVFFFVANGIPLPKNHHATSTDFDATKMFYGNAYEHFTSLAEYLVFLNNMISGRKFDTLQTLTLEKYRQLDKSARFGPFTTNSAFMAICSEADNQIRNASHHGSFVFDADDQVIRYRAGKGGTGPEHEMPYTEYLERCVRIFLQAMTLLRVELILANQLKIRSPL